MYIRVPAHTYVHAGISPCRWIRAAKAQKFDFCHNAEFSARSLAFTLHRGLDAGQSIHLYENLCRTVELSP